MATAEVNARKQANRRTRVIESHSSGSQLTKFVAAYKVGTVVSIKAHPVAQKIQSDKRYNRERGSSAARDGARRTASLLVPRFPMVRHAADSSCNRWPTRRAPARLR